MPSSVVEEDEGSTLSEDSWETVQIHESPDEETASLGSSVVEEDEGSTLSEDSWETVQIHESPDEETASLY
ncbi:hypothetical protein AAES_07985 [Amazona aestiva]|uniref:Uncharacterized protein n=1 Tax=Amazona aestiva TaxID=12930 RepID=A0A0Q3U372_AMAAE|nr:hypothetical protein AAES_07985 [Amazona aestiva]